MLIAIIVVAILALYVIGDYQRKFGARNEVRKLRRDLRNRD